MMLSRIFLVLALFSLSHPVMAETFDYSHKLFQSEFKTWNYDKLFDCSVRYEIVVGVFEHLAADPRKIASSAQSIEQTYKLLFGYALMAGMAQGLSPIELQRIHSRKSLEVTNQLGEYRVANTNQVYGVLARYMNFAKSSCRPYFEALDLRMRDLEKQYLAAN